MTSLRDGDRQTAVPPRLAQRLLHLLAAARAREMACDLDELFHLRVQDVGPRRAARLYWRDVLSICVRKRFRQAPRSDRTLPYPQARGPIMVTSYVRLALRQVRRNTLYTTITVVGLAFGLAGSLLISLFIRDELSYDRHHEKADRIQAVYQWWDYGTYEGTGTTLPPPMGPALQAEYPDVEAAYERDRGA